MMKQSRWASLVFVAVAGMICGAGCIVSSPDVDDDDASEVYDTETAPVDSDSVQADEETDGAGEGGDAGGTDPNGLGSCSSCTKI